MAIVAQETKFSRIFWPTLAWGGCSDLLLSDLLDGVHLLQDGRRRGKA